VFSKFSNLILVFTALLCSSQLANTEDSKTHSVTKIANEYINLYFTVQIEKYGAYFTEETIFEDPTTSLFREDNSHGRPVGKKAVIEFLSRGFEGIFDGEFQLEKKFVSGEFAVFQGNYKYKTKGERLGSEKPYFEFNLPLVTIIRVRDGKVLHHQDYANYEEWGRQYEAQK